MSLKLLLDHNIPRQLKNLLRGHDVWAAEDEGWHGLSNGLLLRTAAANGYNLLLTVDKKMEYEHNLLKLPLPIVLLDCQSNRLRHIQPFLPPLIELLAAPLNPILYVVQMNQVIALTAPRKRK